MLVPIELPPGQFRNGTDLQSRGRWRDASLVRWHEGALRPVGGWLLFKDRTAASIVRTVHAWQSIAGVRFAAMGSANALEVFNRQLEIVDITPADLATGRDRGTQSTGYGVGPYGRGAYGSLYPQSTVGKEASLWSIGNWGEDLVACHDVDGRILLWQRDEAAKATVIAEAPTGCASISVSDNRFLFAFGADGDPRKVAWCDREDYTVWTASATNEAGDFTLNTAGKIQCGVSVQGETLILTDQDAHVARYVGPQLVHEFERAGTACGIVGRNAVAVTDKGAFWMGQGGFYAYSGGQVQHIPCEVSDYVFGDIGRFTGSHVSAVRIGEFSEIWWFYTTGAGIDNTRYVSFNYEQGTWTTGELPRMCGFDRGVFPYPMFMADDNKLYKHENGTVPTGFPVYAESGPIALNGGEQVVSALRMYPDEATQGEVTATFKTRYYPNEAESTHGPYTLTGPTSVRFTGRQIRMRVDGVLGADFRVGTQRLDVMPRGRR